MNPSGIPYCHILGGIVALQKKATAFYFFLAYSVPNAFKSDCVLVIHIYFLWTHYLHGYLHGIIHFGACSFAFSMNHIQLNMGTTYGRSVIIYLV